MDDTMVSKLVLCMIYLLICANAEITNPDITKVLRQAAIDQSTTHLEGGVAKQDIACTSSNLTSLSVNRDKLTSTGFIFLPIELPAPNPKRKGSSTETETEQPGSRRKRHLGTGDNAALYRCGGHVNGSRGVISTPNFPGRFPIPIRCQWILYAPPGKKIMLYLTQFYLRESVRIAEYELYSSEDFYVGKEDLGVISFEETTWLMGYKPYMVITFDVRELGNIHLRVESFLLDVYGFNITYEVIDEKEEPRNDGCSVVECSFLGNCLASHDFKYKCHCFDGYYGDECQFGPYCDPELQINLCKNGGRCRYFYGSMVNTCECPPMYEGSQCEIKREDYINSVCDELECSQLCVEDGHGGYVCSCKDGYRLGTDNKSCEMNAEGQMRFYIQIRVNAEGTQGNNVSRSFNCRSVQDAFVQMINRELADITHNNVTLLSLRQIDNHIYLDFYFMGLKIDKDDIWLRMQAMVFQTSLCSLQMDGGYLVFDAQPAALHVITLRNYDDKPSVEGHLLTLFCKAKGSQHLTFQWKKDGHVVDVHRTERNMWESRIPTYDGETHISVLNIEKADILDEGEFTCIASDWGDTDSRSIHVVVIPKPRMEVSPLTITTEKGVETAIGCLSRDDYKVSRFKYTWAKDGQTLVQGINEEIVEDMLPRGSRVKLTAREPAVYTCTVRSEAGVNEESSRLFILEDSTRDRLCPGELYRAVEWQTTLPHHYDIEPCPKLSEGKAKRKCICQGTTCYWGESNFAQCRTTHLDNIKQNFNRLRLGYQTSDLEHHILELNEFLDFEIRNLSYVRAGDLDLTALFLMDIQQYMYRFLPPHDKSYLYNQVFATVDKILDLCWVITEEEMQELEIKAIIMKLIENIRRDLVFFVETFTYRSRHLNIYVQRKPRCSSDTFKLYKSDSLRIWIENDTKLCNSSVSSYLVNYGHIGHLLNISSPVFYHDNDLVYVGLQSRDYDVRGLQLYIRYLKADNEPNNANRSVCVVWESGANPHWTENGCKTLTNEANYTTCRCILPGHYALFTKSEIEQIPELEIPDDVIHLPMLICLIIAQCGFIISLSTQILFWRSSAGEPRLISLIFILSLIVFCGLLLGGLTYHETQNVCLVLKLSLYFVILVTLCSRLAEAVSLYMMSLSTHTGFVRTKPLATCVEMFIIIGIPLIVFLPVPVVGNVKGFSDNNGLICWIVSDDWEFYGFVIPSGILIVVFVLLIVLSLKNHFTVKTVTVQACRQRFRFYIFRCATSQLLLCAEMVALELFNQYNTLTYEVLSGVVIIIQALFTLVTVYPKILMKQSNKKQDEHCCVCRNQDSSSCINEDCTGQCCSLPIMNTTMTHTTSSSSFKVFVRPQYNHNGTMPVDAEEALKRDQRRYTKEKKEQLVALLGQSSGSDSSKDSQVTATSLSNSSDNERYDGAGSSAPTESNAQSHSHAGSNKSRHHVNALCSCSHCGTRYPFRPARGQSLISVGGDRPILKNASYGGQSTDYNLPATVHRRQSMPDPFPELSDSPPGSTRRPSAQTRAADDNKGKRKPSRSTSRVTFMLGEGD